MLKIQPFSKLPLTVLAVPVRDTFFRQYESELGSLDSNYGSPGYARDKAPSTWICGGERW